MSGRHKKIGGTVTRRANGRYTAQTPPHLDPTTGRMVRPSVGTFDTKDEGWEALDRWSLIDRPIPTPPPAPAAPTEEDSTTVAEYLHEWMRDVLDDEEMTGEIAPSTATDYRQVVRCHLLPSLGRYRVGDLSPAVLRPWIRGLRAHGLSDRTVEKVYRVLHRAFADWEQGPNPVRLPRKDKPRVKKRKTIVRPTLDEVGAFLDHVEACDRPWGHTLHALWRLLATTGLRRSEACGLTWSDLEEIDDGWILSIERGLHTDTGPRFYVKEPKSKEGWRRLGIDDQTVGMLLDYRRATAEGQPVKVDSAEGKVELDLMFRWGRRLGALNPDHVTRWFASEWNHAGLRVGVTLHGLRHGHGSALLADGWTIEKGAARLGHSPLVFAGTYARDLDERARHEAEREAVGRLYG